MFGKKKSETQVSRGPGEIPAPVQHYLISEKKMDAELVPLLRSVVGTDGEAGRRMRIFDQADALARQIDIKDYSSLDQHPELVLYEGWFDDRSNSKDVKLEQKRETVYNVPIFSESEIRQKIEALDKQNNKVSFYMAAGSRHGGPLGMGAAVIELNPEYPGKKQKKYNIYLADVVDMCPVGNGDKLFNSDKPKEIPSWVKNGHRKRQYPF
ncbi:MAG: hypothetical protein HYX87_01355 [Chloroflexi bacterium]|nr:hypothetical protein [Chloroflexota bacterium]